LIELKDGVYWVGAVDWGVRSFHGYIIPRGTTYNSYLIVDDKVTLVDFVKAPFAEDQLSHIREIVDPKEIDYIVSNHAEPDHSGSIRRMIEEAPQAEVVATSRGRMTLQRYYGEDLKITSIEEKPGLSLGKRSLTFVPVPMAHWPDSMVSYIPEERLLLSNDAFGQHLASSGRFDDEVDGAVLMQEATSYYANILMPLWRSVGRAVNALSGVKVDMIAPSHGVIWRSKPGLILDAYKRWLAGETKNKAVIVYDTMWGSTEKVARAIAEGVAAGGVEVKLFSLSSSHNSDVVTELLEAKAVLVGSPTLNNHVFPTVAGFLAYMRGLKPVNKIGAAFGSYGWGGGAKRFVEAEMQAAGVQLIESDLDFVFRPNEAELKRAFEYGKMIAGKVAA
jgi:anaerobic nitric oxide reductase flavorubredoxin